MAGVSVKIPGTAGIVEAKAARMAQVVEHGSARTESAVAKRGRSRHGDLGR